MPEATPHPLDTMFTAHEVLSTTYPPIGSTVPGLIHEGLTLLVAAPKICKSWFVLGLAVACVTGGYTLGSVRVEQRPVLYLALEDGHRRLKSRLNKLGIYEPAPEYYKFCLVVDLGPSIVQMMIGEFLKEHGAQKPLIILDTLGRARGVHAGNDAYGKDYNDVPRLKRCVDEYPGSSLIVVHHTNNRGGGEDFLGAISGTQGLAGAADSTLVIRRDRGQGQARLQVMSREVQEGEYAIRFDNGQWFLMGATLEEAVAAAIQSGQVGALGDVQTRILEHFNKYPEPQSTDHAASALNEDKVGHYLRRLNESGKLQRSRRGKFAILPEPALVNPMQNSVRNPDYKMTPL